MISGKYSLWQTMVLPMWRSLNLGLDQSIALVWILLPQQVTTWFIHNKMSFYPFSQVFFYQFFSLSQSFNYMQCVQFLGLVEFRSPDLALASPSSEPLHQLGVFVFSFYFIFRHILLVRLYLLWIILYLKDVHHKGWCEIHSLSFLLSLESSYI